jgi:hypothetical protein
MNSRIEYPILRSLVIDSLPTAFGNEKIVGEYLVPPPAGIYTLGSIEPVMWQARSYYQERPDGAGNRCRVPVRSIEDIQPEFPVINDEGELAVKASQIRLLSNASPLPIRGIEIIERTLRALLAHYGNPENRHHNTEPCALYLDLVRPQYQHELEIIDQILMRVSDLRAQVKEFAGHDRWIIHFLRRNRTTMFIEKSIDWRIVLYYRLTGELNEQRAELQDE